MVQRRRWCGSHGNDGHIYLGAPTRLASTSSSRSSYRRAAPAPAPSTTSTSSISTRAEPSARYRARELSPARSLRLVHRRCLHAGLLACQAPPREAYPGAASTRHAIGPSASLLWDVGRGWMDRQGGRRAQA